MVNPLDPVDPSFWALSGRLQFTVRRHKVHNDYVSMHSRDFQLARPPHARPHTLNVQGCIADKKMQSPRTLQLAYTSLVRNTHPHRITIVPRHMATVGSYGGDISHERGTPVIRKYSLGAGAYPCQQEGCGGSMGAERSPEPHSPPTSPRRLLKQCPGTFPIHLASPSNSRGWQKLTQRLLTKSPFGIAVPEHDLSHLPGRVAGQVPVSAGRLWRKHGSEVRPRT